MTARENWDGSIFIDLYPDNSENRPRITVKPHDGDGNAEPGSMFPLYPLIHGNREKSDDGDDGVKPDDGDGGLCPIKSRRSDEEVGDVIERIARGHLHAPIEAGI